MATTSCGNNRSQVCHVKDELTGCLANKTKLPLKQKLLRTFCHGYMSIRKVKVHPITTINQNKLWATIKSYATSKC